MSNIRNIVISTIILLIIHQTDVKERTAVQNVACVLSLCGGSFSLASEIGGSVEFFISIMIN